MRLRTLVLASLVAVSAQAVLVDRIAIVANDSIIKDSDIARDVRLTDFLNGDPLSLAPDARKKAADRLVDQVFIRNEIRVGDYPTATVEQAQDHIQALIRDKYKSDEGLQAALGRYGLTEADLQMHLQWQLTVLQFIDLRFKPAAYITDQQVTDYIKAHDAELKQQHPKASEADLKTDVQQQMSAERVNTIFFNWLDNQRKSAQIQYMEDSLK